MAKSKRSSISHTNTLETLGEFWDTHDFTEFDDPNAPDVEFDIACAVPIEVELFSSVEKQAKLRGINVETLINLWVQQKLDEHLSTAKV